MQGRYERNFPAISEAEFQLLRSKRVFVAGCGGLGGYLIELMARLGVGSIRAVDGDVFDVSNLNRQLLSQEPLIGQSKASCAALHCQSINSDVQFEGIHTYITQNNAQELIRDCDIVLDGLDNIQSRKILAKACQDAKIPYVYGAISGWVAQAAISMPGDGLIQTLYPEGTELGDKSVLSFTPALCASMQAALCTKLLIGRPVETGTIYYFDLLNQEFETIGMVV